MTSEIKLIVFILSVIAGYLLKTKCFKNRKDKK